MILEEGSRRKLIVFTSLLCFLCVIPSCALITVGLYAKIFVESKTRLIEGFQVQLPGIIMYVGSYGAFHNLVSGGLLMASRLPRKRENRACFLFLGVLVGFLLLLTLTSLTIICFIQPLLLDKSFHDGFLKAMKSYKENTFVKTEVDELQMIFECCGSHGYTDWFKISWIKDQYVSSFKKGGKDDEGGYINDDVPFSCCDPNSPRQCINHHVHDNDMHYNYFYEKQITIYTKGCREAMIKKYGGELMYILAYASLAATVLQFLILLLTRLVQTSIQLALDEGDPEADTPGYICKNSEEDGQEAAAPAPAGHYNYNYNHPQHNDLSMNAVVRSSFHKRGESGTSLFSRHKSFNFHFSKIDDINMKPRNTESISSEDSSPDSTFTDDDSEMENRSILNTVKRHITENVDTWQLGLSKILLPIRSKFTEK